MVPVPNRLVRSKCHSISHKTSQSALTSSAFLSLIFPSQVLNIPQICHFSPGNFLMCCSRCCLFLEQPSLLLSMEKLHLLDPSSAATTSGMLSLITQIWLVSLSFVCQNYLENTSIILLTHYTMSVCMSVSTTGLRDPWMLDLTFFQSSNATHHDESQE